MKTSAKETQKKPIVGKRKILLIGLGVVILLVLAGLVSLKVGQHNDQLRFAEVNSRQSAVVGTLVRDLGTNVTSVEEKNICFNTEQGPYDNGKLWCQVATSQIKRASRL